MIPDDLAYHDIVQIITDECRLALSKISPESVEQLTDAILLADKVFFIGVGRVMLCLEAMAKRLSHLGISTVCVGQITEPAITNRDILIVGSASGESLIPVGIAQKAKSYGAKIAHIGANPSSSLREITDILIHIPVRTKMNLHGEINSAQPMTSLFEQSLFLLGDAIAVIIINRQKIDIEDLWQFHANLE